MYTLIMHDRDRIIQLIRHHLHFDFIRAAGPGGQNVNKVASAVQLRFNVRASSLPAEVKTRLLLLAGSRATKDQILVIEARRHRTQDQNREDATDRLIKLIEKSFQIPAARHKTRPSAASKEKRLQSKKRHADMKKSRRDHALE